MASALTSAAAAAALALALFAASAGLLVQALDNGLARTPPMGWLAWERFTCQVDCVRHPSDCINAELFKQMADRMADDGWLGLGYEYVHIDDCWSERERADGTRKLAADQRRFPAGIRALADYVHGRAHGLKLGIYGDCGTKTCAGYPAQLKYNDSLRTLEKPLALDADNRPRAAEGQEADDYVMKESTYFALDAQTLADWHVDSLKFDGCYVDPLRAAQICSRMAPALRATERPFLLICEWPFYEMYAHSPTDYELVAESCNVWRYFEDIEGPGHWFDPDQLVIGNFGLSHEQSRAQMAIWCIWAAPLYMSNDLRNIRPEHVAILQNRRLIEVNQDELGVFGQMVASSGDGRLQAFVKPTLPVRRGCPSFAIVYLNRNTLGNKQKVSFRLADLLADAPLHQAAQNQRDVLRWAARRGGGAAGDSDQLERLFERAASSTRAPESQTVAATSASVALEDEDERDGAQSGAESTLIAPDDCLGRLKSGDESLEFELVDLFDDSPATSIGANDSLELLVSPSGVRAVKLVEK